MISCTDAVRQLWDYLDRTIGEEERSSVEEHLNLCKRCCGEAEFAVELRKVLSSQRYDDLPPDAQARLTTFLEGI